MKLPTTISFMPVAIGLAFASCSGESMTDTGVNMQDAGDLIDASELDGSDELDAGNDAPSVPYLDAAK